MEKHPIRFSKGITAIDKFYLACLVFCAPVGLALLVYKRGITTFLNFYVLLILVASWLNWLSWIDNYNNYTQIIVATVINSLPFAAFFFLIEERKYYSSKKRKITLLDYIVVTVILILCMQLSSMAMTRMSGSDIISDCSELVKATIWGMVFTLIVFIVSLKHFVKSNGLLDGYFEYIPDNYVTLWIFSLVGIVAIFTAPVILKGVPNVLYLFGCL